ncbi:MAG: hypothetical protein V2I36_00715 [Desulfopila sp.]|nr:hypothetical protein [Desulfopila sp.]
METEKVRRVEVRCAYCRTYLSEYFYKHTEESCSFEGGDISHGICPSRLTEHCPNEYPTIRKALPEEAANRHAAIGTPDK